MAYANSAPTSVRGQSVRFAQVPLTIIRDPHLSEIDKTVYAALAVHRNARHGQAWPKRSTVAKRVGCPDSVSRSTARLVECSYLTKTDGRGRGCTTFYRFPLAASDKFLMTGRLPTSYTAPLKRQRASPERPALHARVNPARGRKRDQ